MKINYSAVKGIVCIFKLHRPKYIEFSNALYYLIFLNLENYEMNLLKCFSNLTFIFLKNHF